MKVYTLQIHNHTDFLLDTVKLSLGDSQKIMTLAPNSLSEEFDLRYKVSAWNVFGSGTLVIRNEVYSDSTSTYHNIYGTAIERSNLKSKKKNLIVISKDHNEASFKIELI